MLVAKSTNWLWLDADPLAAVILAWVKGWLSGAARATGVAP